MGTGLGEGIEIGKLCVCVCVCVRERERVTGPERRVEEGKGMVREAYLPPSYLANLTMT